MPLEEGSKPKTIRTNISELIRKFKKTHTIGNSKPKNLEAAKKQAVAIAHKKAGK